MATHSSILAWRTRTEETGWAAVHGVAGRKELDTTERLSTAH